MSDCHNITFEDLKMQPRLAIPLLSARPRLTASLLTKGCRIRWPPTGPISTLRTTNSTTRTTNTSVRIARGGTRTRRTWVDTRKVATACHLRRSNLRGSRVLPMAVTTAPFRVVRLERLGPVHPASGNISMLNTQILRMKVTGKIKRNMDRLLQISVDWFLIFMESF